MAGKKKSTEKKTTVMKQKEASYTKSQQDDILCNMISSMVGAKQITAFIIIAENDESNHIRVCNMEEVKCLGYAGKLALLMKNRMLIQMGKTNEDNKPE